MTTNRLTTADRHGVDYAFALVMYAETYDKVHWFSDQHPLTIPNPDPRWGPNSYIVNPEKHTVRRDGDWMFCIECNEACETGTIPKRPLTPMEASISGWD